MYIAPVVIHRDRKNYLTVDLGMDVSLDVLTSQIRVEEDVNSELLATWAVSFATDGTDGQLVLTLEKADVDGIVHTNAFMDIKRTTGGEPLSAFLQAIPVVFKGVVTA